MREAVRVKGAEKAASSLRIVFRSNDLSRQGWVHTCPGSTAPVGRRLGREG